jgi:hypothetical protein
VRIRRAAPVSPIISGSHSTLKTSPTTGSMTLKGNRTSSLTPVMNLRGCQMLLRQSRRTAYPGTVIITFTRLLLCKGKSSNVLTNCVRRAMPRPAMPDPVRTPPVVMMAAPPAPPRNAPVPVTPTVANAVPIPAPITGASRPAERPMTSPPPVRACCLSQPA